MPQTKLLYPYEYSSQIRLTPSDPHDPADEARVFKWTPVDEESDEDVTTLDLSHEDRNWDRLRFRVEASLPEDEVATLIQAGATVSEDLRMYVGVTCPSTRLREAVELAFADGRWVGHVLVRRGQVRDTVQLSPFLVRATDLPDSATGVDGPIGDQSCHARG